MGSETRFLRSRFARRMLLTFLLCALFPVITLSFLSFSRVSDLLNRQSQAQLQELAKGTGMMLIHHLRNLKEDLAELVPGSASASQTGGSTGRESGSPLSQAKFNRIVSFPLTSATESGDDRLALEPGQRTALLAGKTVIQTLQFGDQPARMFFLRLGPASGGQRVLLRAEVSDRFWRPFLDVFEGNEDLCIFDRFRRPLRCTSDKPFALHQNVLDAMAERHKGEISFREDGREYLGGHWSLFLGADFDDASWTIVTRLPRNDALWALEDFQSIFVPVIALALLTVFLLTLYQIRTKLSPLDLLKEATLLISQGAFATRVKIKSGDEFEELGDGFNAMAERIGKQFRSLTAMSEIDRLILSSLDTEQIIRTVLERTQEIVPVDFVSMLLIDNGTDRRGRLYYNQSDQRGDLTEKMVQLTYSEVSLLTKPSNHRFSFQHTSVFSFLAGCTPPGKETIIAVPIAIKGDFAAAIFAGSREGEAMLEDDRKRLREFVDRVAVALANARWESELYRQAHYDALTGLPNRALLIDRVEQAMARAQRGGDQVAVLFLDLDRFKRVNDSYGHGSGDLFLIEIAKRLRAAVRGTDSVVRFGGDEFVVVVPDIDSTQDPVVQISHFAEKLLECIAQPFSIDQRVIYPNASIGIAVYPQDGQSVEELLRFSDAAMYSAKALGRGRYNFYAPDMNVSAMRKLDLDHDVRHALNKGEFELYYQPQVETASGRITGVESLIRWSHPEKGFISPGEFIPFAEESGLIIQIGEWVLREACAQALSWKNSTGFSPRIAVNVSSVQFADPQRLLATIANVLSHMQLDPGLIEIEVTEGTIMRDLDQAIRTLNAFRDLGIQVAVDDFGTGYSSLNYLRSLPIDVLKIDNSFVREMLDDTRTRSIVSSIIHLAHALDLKVIAEGVELADQRALLELEGCDRIQGYLIGRPMPANECARWIRTVQGQETLAL